MQFISKLKPPKLFTEILIGLVIAIPFLLTMIVTNDISQGFKVVFPFFALSCFIGPWLYFRTMNPGYLVYSVFFLSLTALAYTIGFEGFEGNKTILLVQVCICIIFTIWLYYLIFTRRLKFRTREIFELAARNLNESTDSFSERPYPAGKSDYSKDDIYAFSLFLKKNLIAIPFYEADRVVLSLDTSYGRVYGFNKHYNSQTWVSFDFEGNILVTFAMKDYLGYKEELTYDQLCESLGKLFIHFLDLYLKGKEVMIIDQLNELKLNPMT